ncbi:hypothetical protein Tco_0869742 [Tanacetum coccineum]
MENTNPFVPVPLNGLRTKISQELNELHAISAVINSRLENIDHTQIIISPHVPFEQLLNDFMNPLDVFEMDDLESDNESVDTPLVSPFIDSDEVLDDGEVFNDFWRRCQGNVEANIDPSLSQVVFGRPFVETIKLILDREPRLITFTDGIREVTFKTPYRDSKMNDLTSKGHDLLSSRVILSDDDFRRGYESPLDLENGFYNEIDKLGPSYNKIIERLDSKGPMGNEGSRTSERVT